MPHVNKERQAVAKIIILTAIFVICGVFGDFGRPFASAAGLTIGNPSLDLNGGNLIYGTTAAGANGNFLLFENGANNGLFQVDSLGIASIGTTTKEKLLNVAGEGKFYNYAYGLEPTSFQTDAFATVQYVADALSNGTGPWKKTASYIYPSTLTDSVGIGTTAPTAPLNVSGTLNGASSNAIGVLFNQTLKTTNVNGLTQTGLSVAPNFDTTSSNVSNSYGLRISPTHTGTYTTSNAYGLYVDAPALVSGIITNNYAAVFNGGSVGIGTTNPNATLTVKGANSGLSFAVKDVNNNYLMYTTGASATSNLIIPAMAVGVGTTNPSSPFQVVNSIAATPTIRVTNNASSGVIFPMFLEAPNMGDGSTLAFALGKSASANNRVSFAYNHVTDGSLSNRYSVSFFGADNLFNVLASGKVGVGTTSPEMTFDIAGTAKFFGYASGLTPPASQIDALTTVEYVNSALSNGTGPWRRTGSNVYTSTSTDNVGIGTTNPETKFFLSGANSTSTGLTIGRSNYANDNLNIFVQDTETDITHNENSVDAANGHGEIVFSTNAAEGVNPANGGFRFKGPVNTFVRILNNGNVGLGTTNPWSKLEIYKTASGASIPASSGTTDPTVISRLHYGSIVLDSGILDGGSAFIQNRVVTDFSQNYPLLLNPNGGFVGIGTTNPGQKLEVNGNLKFTSGTTISTGAGNIILSPYGALTRINGGDHFLDIDGYNNSRVTLTSEDSAIELKTPNNVGQLFLNTDSHVGIGSTSPEMVLTVAGAAKFSGYAFGLEPSSTQKDAFATVQYVADALADGTGPWKRTGSNVFTSTSTDSVGIGTSNPTSKLDVFGTYTDVSLSATSTAIASFRASGHVQLAVSAQLASPYTISMQGKHTVTAGSSYPIALNPLGGNVGIGTTDPGTYKLNVVGEIYASSNIFGSTVYSNKYRDQAGGIISLQDDGGNVGVGTASPNYPLEVKGAASSTVLNVLGVFNTLNGTSAQNNGVAILLGHSNSGYYNKIATVFEQSNPSYLNPALAFYTMNGSNLPGSELERMRISSAGSVGIGTTSPAVKLEVVGNIRANGQVQALQTGGASYMFTMDAANGSGPRLQLGTLSSPASYFEIGAWGSINNFDSKSRDLKLYNSGGLVYLRNSDGAFGIGTTTPEKKFDVAGTAKFFGYADGLTPASTQDHAFTTVEYVNGALLNGTGPWKRVGSNVYTSTSTDSVGIGTLSPGAKLDVAGGIYAGSGESHLFQGTYFDPVGGTQAAVKISQNAGNAVPSAPFVAGINGTAAANYNTYAGYFNNASTVSGSGLNYGLYVQGSNNYFSGKVGIGAPVSDFTFDVRGLGYFGDADREGVILGFDYIGGELGMIDATNDTLIAGKSADGLSYKFAGYDEAGITYNIASGNVGIGTTNPTATFTVAGSAKFDGFVHALTPSDTDADALTTVAFVSGLVNSSTSTVGNKWTKGGDTVGAVKNFGTTDNYALPFITNNTERMRIDNLGNVGIGTTNPLAKLQIDTASSWGGAWLGSQVGGQFSVYRNYGSSGTAVGDNIGFFGALKITSSNPNGITLANYGWQADAVSTESQRTPTRFVMSLSDGNSLVERLRVTSAGYVGIGTTTPAKKLTISSNSTDGWIHLETTSGNPIISSAAGLNFQTSGTISSLFMSNGGISVGRGYANVYAPPTDGAIIQGNVGLGTTNPGAKLDIAGTGSTPLVRISNAPTISSVGGTDLIVRNLGQLRFGSNNDWDWNSWGGIFYNSTTSTMYIGGSAGTPFNRNGAGTNAKIIFDGVTNVGVGTTNPAKLLAVGGQAIFDGWAYGLTPSKTSTSSLTTVEYVETKWTRGGDTVGSLKNLGTVDNYSLPFITNNTERMRITNLGKVGIGTTNPQADLDLRGGLSLNHTSVADTDYTATSSDYIIGYTSLTANKTVQLPNALCTPGRFFVVLDESGSSSPSKEIIIDPEGSTKIVGQDTFILSSAYNSVYVFCGNTSWYVL